MGSGTGKKSGYQFFVCKRDFGAFVPIEAVIPEKVFDENPEQATRQETVEKQDQIHEDELYTRSMSCVDTPSGRVFSEYFVVSFTLHQDMVWLIHSSFILMLYFCM